MEQATPFELVLNLPADAGLTDRAHANRALLVDTYKRLLEGEVELMFDLCAPDVTFHEAASLPYGCDNVGVEGARTGVAGMFGAWSHVRSEFLEFTAGGDLVIAYLRFTGTSKVTGRSYDGMGTEVFRFRDGKIVEWRPFYWDTHAVREACGL